MDQESNITDIYKYLESTDNIFSLFSASGFFQLWVLLFGILSLLLMSYYSNTLIW